MIAASPVATLLRRLALAATLVLALLLDVGGTAPEAVGAAEPRADALRGRLPVPALWSAWVGRFVTADGRVVDDLAGGVSHSESQGYGMILAVAADDPAVFRRIWTWTRANLFVRADGLASWRWQPGPAPNVRDPNDASDGDLLVAWALAEAGEAWGEPAHTLAARRIAKALFDHAVVPTRFGPTLLPAVDGFRAGQRKDGPVINPSYAVFPAYAALARLLPEFDWAGLAASGEKILAATRIGTTGLPPEWASLAGVEIAPADGLPASFGYNAVRVPLYLAWGPSPRRERLAPFMARWFPDPAGRPSMAVVDLASGRSHEPFVEPGYRAVAAVVACALEGTRIPDDLRGAEVDHYYPSTLRALALLAVAVRHPTCW